MRYISGSCSIFKNYCPYHFASTKIQYHKCHHLRLDEKLEKQADPQRTWKGSALYSC